MTQEDERFELQKLDGHWEYFYGANNTSALEGVWAHYNEQYCGDKLVGVAEIRLVQIRPKFQIIWNELI